VRPSRSGRRCDHKYLMLLLMLMMMMMMMMMLMELAGCEASILAWAAAGRALRVQRAWRQRGLNQCRLSFALVPIGMHDMINRDQGPFTAPMSRPIPSMSVLHGPAKCKHAFSYTCRALHEALSVQRRGPRLTGVLLPDAGAMKLQES
jgi:hypothetical protein